MIANQKLEVALIHLKLNYSRIRKYKFHEIAVKALRKISTLFFTLIFFPIAVIFYFLNIRRLCIFTQRIGHLAIEPDTLLKAQKLGLIQTKKWIILAPRHQVANQHLLQYWQPFFFIFQSRFLCFLLNCITWWRFVRYDVSYFINKDMSSQFSYHVHQLWGNKPPIVSLTEADKAWGNEMLAKLGLPKNAWFVCIHAREAGFSPVDEMIQNHRNSSVENLFASIQAITSRGGWVIRLGDPTTTPLQSMHQVIDYAHHPLRSERLDIVLCARARFILGNTSGIFIVGSIFGTPCALANMIPMPTLGFNSYDISIPKMYWCEDQKRFLSFQEVLSSPLATYRYAQLYHQAKFKVIENSEDDILLMTTEMLEKMDKTFIESEEDKIRQKNFLALLKPIHYAYGTPAKISTKFLRKYQNLLKQ